MLYQIKTSNIMKITYKNITFKFEHEPEEFNGACYFEFKTNDIQRYISENEGSEQANELLNEFEDEENVMECVYTSDTDLAIYIFYWMLYECPNDQFELDYRGESPFWMFHDLSHAENDVNGGVLWVDEYREEERIFDGLKLLKKHNMLEEFKPQMFESIVTDFRNRWKHEIDTKRIIKKMGWKKKDFRELLEYYEY